MGWTIQVSILSRGMRFFFSPSMSRLAMGSNQPTIQWVLGVLSLWVKHLEHRHQMTRLRMKGTIFLLLPYAFIARTEKTYFINYEEKRKHFRTSLLSLLQCCIKHSEYFLNEQCHLLGHKTMQSGR